VTTCAECGRENTPDARFCSACGSALDSEEWTGETRKVVTVVFTDVHGSTSLGERLDPESLRHVMSRYFDTMQAALERHGGTVEKFIGDAIMSVFGIPTMHEDDALRAVRGAVEMRDELARVNEELDRVHGVRIAARTGVNTGQVVAGDASARQKLVTGDAVNVAARLEQTAGPGEIMLGDDTYQLVRDAVRVEQLEPLSMKGKSEPVAAWRLVELLPDVPAFTRPIAAPFVGRAQELAALEHAFETAAREGDCRLATIVGPPGIGKSRMARELIGALSGRARVLVGRCLPYGEGITYWPLAEIVRQLAGRDLERGLAELMKDTDQPALVPARIAAAIGMGDGASSPEETAWAFRKLFEALGRKEPLLVVVDDIHWAEPTLLDLLEYLVSFSTGVPILILCLARPELFDGRPTWAAPRPNTTLLPLSPLSAHETKNLIDRLLEQRMLSDQMEARIVEAADGNPLFVEQMLAMQADAEGDGDRVVPPTIHALLTARIDRLGPEEREVIERASVEGRLFHRGAVAELLPPHARPRIAAQLMSLIRKEFVRPDRELFPGDDGFRFNHILIRDAAYESIPKRLRAQLHERYAEWLERQVGGDDAAEYEEILGYHFELAYRYRAELGQVNEEGEAAASKAGALLARAGRRALARGDARAAARLLQRAADLLVVDPSTRTEVLPDCGLALAEAGDLDGADRVLAEAIERGQESGDRRSEVRAEVQRARIGIKRGVDRSVEHARTAAERAIAVFGELGDEAELAGAWMLLGLAESLSGNGAAGVAAHRRARDHARRAGDDRREREIWDELGGAMLFSRTPVDEVMAFGDEEVAWAREKGFQFPEADGSLVGAYVYPMLGRFEEGRALVARSKSLFEELGAMYNLAEACWAASLLETLAGDARAAERELRHALRIHEEMGARRYSAFIRAQLAHVLHRQGRDDEAIKLLEAARGEAASGNIRFEALWRTARAKILASAGDAEEASGLAREAVGVVAVTDNINLQADTLVDLAEVLRSNGEEPEAATALEQAAALYEEKVNVLGAKRARDAIASIGIADSDSLRRAGDVDPGDAVPVLGQGPQQAAL
jgi:class 3 adenylate cyclase/tetratricopeptide (TPR) repeat protein